MTQLVDNECTIWHQFHWHHPNNCWNPSFHLSIPSCRLKQRNKSRLLFPCRVRNNEQIPVATARVKNSSPGYLYQNKSLNQSDREKFAINLCTSCSTTFTIKRKQNSIHHLCLRNNNMQAQCTVQIEIMFTEFCTALHTTTARLRVSAKSDGLTGFNMPAPSFSDYEKESTMAEFEHQAMKIKDGRLQPFDLFN